MSPISEEFSEEVRRFFESVEYRGLGFLTLGEIEESTHSPGRVFYVIPNETPNPPLTQRRCDFEWHEKLASIGKRRGVHLRLPNWFFADSRRSA